MSNGKILLVISDSSVGSMLDRAVLRPAGYDVTLVADPPTAETMARVTPPDLMIVGENLIGGSGIEFGEKLLGYYPALVALLLASTSSQDNLARAFRAGFVDCLLPPLRPADVIKAVESGLTKRRRLVEWAALESRRNTKMLQKRVDGLEALQRVGRSVTSLLELDSILTTVVDAAVDLTGAEEGSLLLLDEDTGELYMRAARNFQEDFVRKFRLPIRDTLAGQVMRTGKPLAINAQTPQKIKTSYLVHTLIYVPLQVHNRIIGILGVDNRQSGHPFLEEHLVMVSALADYAAIAIENARSYEHTNLERKKLETILKKVEDGVLVVDFDGRLVIANRMVASAFGIEDTSQEGRPIKELIHHPDLLEIFDEKRVHPSRSEISLEDGRVLYAQVTPIPEVGLAVTMQDITHLKELDRIKSDFVSTVSHDLRSPLTAILGYVELLDRAGPVTDQQREFIRRIQFSVNNITALINDLLDLGRIEAGFDARKEIAPLDALINYSVEGLRIRFEEKQQKLIVKIPEKLPPILGNPVRLRQLFTNLIGNANKYTPVGGEVSVIAQAEGDQIILSFTDNGPGIPPTDQPYIFDKFYRASNVPYDTPGTGLGLAIVKSIVENHQGRIWVESNLGQGTRFTLVLPVADQQL